MFQFRRFPTYYYFIHSTLTRYCRAGFPHSDIHGSQDICSSPWLFAACHVLLRLLMPRHSPCALSSLTYRHLSVTRYGHIAVLRIMQASQKFFACCCVTLKVPHLLLATLLYKAWRPLLPCFSSSFLCSVFKVQKGESLDRCSVHRPLLSKECTL